LPPGKSKGGNKSKRLIEGELGRKRVREKEREGEREREKERELKSYFEERKIVATGS
jgi:hypothetical protein